MVLAFAPNGSANAAGLLNDLIKSEKMKSKHKRLLLLFDYQRPVDGGAVLHELNKITSTYSLTRFS